MDYPCNITLSWDTPASAEFADWLRERMHEVSLSIDRFCSVNGRSAEHGEAFETILQLWTQFFTEDGRFTPPLAEHIWRKFFTD